MVAGPKSNKAPGGAFVVEEKRRKRFVVLTVYSIDPPANTRCSLLYTGIVQPCTPVQTCTPTQSWLRIKQVFPNPNSKIRTSQQPTFVIPKT